MFTISNTENEEFTFYIGEDTKVVIEENERAKHSIFNKVYCNFFKMLDQYINLLEKTKRSNDDNDDVCQNNIFAFVGERGTGKTSCMRSIAKMLENDSSVLSKSYKFEVLESTDPSFFSNDQNILNIFIGRLFSRFQKEVKKNGTHKIKERNEVIESFEEVKDALAHMNECKICDENNLDQLLNLCAVVELRPSIRKLIESYLKYADKDYLVIPIDDIDLHTSFAYEMAEQIRKYLSQNKTLILMALKPQQLNDVIENHYLIHYKLMLEKGLLKEDAISDMASKYMIKLIPQAHHFPLKSIKEIVNEKVKIIDITQNKEIDFKEENLKEILTSLIFAKTRYLMYHPEFGHSPIIPSTLRECRQLIELLYRMPNYDEKADGIYNKNRFKEYFFNDWASNNCSTEGYILLNALYNYPSADSFNKFVVQVLRGRYKEFFERTVPIRDRDRDVAPFSFEIGNILNQNCFEKNISLGDVLTIIHHIERNTYRIADDNLFLGIKFIYSIRLYEFYNKLVDKVKNLEQQKKDDTNGSKNQEIEKKRIQSEYYMIIGGSFVNNNDDYFELTPTGQKRFYNNRLDIRLINLKNLKEGFKNNTIPLNVTELYALLISREYLKNNDDAYRIRNKNYYLGNFSPDTEYVWCNLFSIFYNITNIEYCYKRVCSELWDAAQEDENSLLNGFKKSFKSRNSQNPFLSCSCIRNMDVLDLLSTALSQTFNGEEQDPAKTIFGFFEKIKEFKKETYDRNPEGERFKIDFRFGRTIVQVLESNDKKILNQFINLYNAIPEQNKLRIEQIEKEIENAKISSINSSERLKILNISSKKDDEQNKELINTFLNDDYKSSRIKNFNTAITNAMEKMVKDSVIAKRICNLFKDVDPLNREAYTDGMSALKNWLNSVPVID